MRGKIGTSIRARRLELGLSQNKLAELIGVHPQTIHKIENGRIKASRHFHPIGEALGIDHLLLRPQLGVHRRASPDNRRAKLMAAKLDAIMQQLKEMRLLLLR